MRARTQRWHQYLRFRISQNDQRLAELKGLLGVVSSKVRRFQNILCDPASNPKALVLCAFV